jgi:hypothetical protein
MRQKLIAAAIQRFELQRVEAATNLEIYLECPVGVAEHPNVVQEVAKLVRQIAEAEECIETLQKL